MMPKSDGLALFKTMCLNAHLKKKMGLSTQWIENFPLLYQQMSNSVSGSTVQLKRADNLDDFDSALMTSVFATDLGH